MKTAMMLLIIATAQLPLVNISLPSSTIGHDTTSAIQSGVMWDMSAWSKELLERMTVELGQEYTIGLLVAYLLFYIR
ncbi:MAG: type III pantothenate kinase [Saprospiraceae bacterium]